MLYRTLTAFTLSLTTLFGAIVHGGGATEAVTQPAVVVPHISKVDVMPTKEELATYELAHQDRLKRIPTMAYWKKVAQCESQNRWNDKGTYAGGLGIYTKGRFVPKQLKRGVGTWEYFGGEDYAPSPDKATKTQQIVIANRIALFGYRTSFTLPAGLNGALMTFQYNKKPVGFTGWGCIRNTIGKPRHKDLQ